MRLQAQPEVNLAYYNNKSREWVSVSGTARLVSDRDLIRTLYKPDWKAWFGDEGGDRNGGPNDPRLVLIEIEAHEATYLKSNQPRAVQLFKVAKALITREPPKIGDMRHVGKERARSASLDRARSRQRLGFTSRCAKSHFHNSSSAYALSHAPCPRSGYSVYCGDAPSARSESTSVRSCTTGTRSSFSP